MCAYMDTHVNMLMPHVSASVCEYTRACALPRSAARTPLPARARLAKVTRVRAASVSARLARSRRGGRGARPWPGQQREEEEKEEEGSAAQTARRQQTPANSSGHTMANTGGNRRLRQRSDCIRLRRLPRGERAGSRATGTAAGLRSTFTTLPPGISFCPPHPLFSTPAV